MNLRLIAAHRTLIMAEKVWIHQLEPLMYDRQRSYSDDTRPGDSLIEVPGSNKKVQGIYPKIYVNDQKISNSVNSS